MQRFEFPIRLDEPVWRSNPRQRIQIITARDLAGADWSFLAGEEGPRIEASGRTSDGVRLTNLCGVRDGELRKRCPHCDLRKPVSAFGDRGRMDGRRDQSHCNTCRAGRARAHPSACGS
jgi:hypothetical protein